MWVGRTTQYSVFQCMSTIPVGQGPAEPHISHKPPNRTQTQKTTPHQKDELFLIFASHPSYTKTHTSECSPNPRLNKHHHYTHPHLHLSLRPFSPSKPSKFHFLSLQQPWTTFSYSPFSLFYAKSQWYVMLCTPIWQTQLRCSPYQIQLYCLSFCVRETAPVSQKTTPPYPLVLWW